MMKMSFYNGTLNKKVLIEFIESTDKPIKFTFGFKYRNPTTYLKPVTKEQAIEIIHREGLLDATEKDDYVDLNAYGGNDMW